MSSQGGVRGKQRRNKYQGGGLIGKRIGQSLYEGTGGKNGNTPTNQRGGSSKRGGQADPVNRGGGHFLETGNSRGVSLADHREQSSRTELHSVNAGPEGVQNVHEVPGGHGNDRTGGKVQPNIPKEPVPHTERRVPRRPGSTGKVLHEPAAAVDPVNRRGESHASIDGAHVIQTNRPPAKSTTTQDHHPDISSRSASFDKIAKPRDPHIQHDVPKNKPYVSGPRKPGGLSRGYRGPSAAGGPGQAEAIGNRPVTAAGKTPTSKPSAQVNAAELPKGLQQNRVLVEETSIRIGGGPILDNTTKTNLMKPPGADRPRPCSVAKNITQQEIGESGKPGESSTKGGVGTGKAGVPPNSNRNR